MSCDICDVNAVRARPGQYQVCRNCGAEFGAPDIDLNEMRDLLSDHDALAMQPDFDDDDEAPGLTRKRLEEVGDKLSGYLWQRRWTFMHAIKMRDDRLAAISRIVRRSLACGQLEKLEDARPYLDEAERPEQEPQGAPRCKCGHSKNAHDVECHVIGCDCPRHNE